MRPRGRLKILKSLRYYLSLERFNCCGVFNERVVKTDFYALDEELRKLRELAGKKRIGPLEYFDAADRLALVIHDLKARSTTPTEFVREHFRIYRDSWIEPLIAELEGKER